MTLEEQVKVLQNSDALRIIKDDKEIFIGYLGVFNPQAGEHKGEIFEKCKNDTVKKLRAITEIKHKNWEELGLAAPLQPNETPDYYFADLQEKLYYTIYL